MNARVIHEAAAKWYAANARDLPWRKPPFAGDPYAVLVSEVMLQQTQVDRTIGKFLEFMERFPTIGALAEGSPGEVIRIWAGMGYNGRAVRLHRLARLVVNELDGELPVESSRLRALPGIGPYTAAAVACFAFGASVPVLDTNVYRVLGRLEHGVKPPSRREIEPLAQSLLPDDDEQLDASTWHQAIMDIGATLCSTSKPRCMLCPFRGECAAAPVLQDGGSRALAESSVPYVVKQGRFAGSRRFFRGRAVEALRFAGSDGLSLAELDRNLRNESGSDTAWLKNLVADLVRDGLAVSEAGRVRLP